MTNPGSEDIWQRSNGEPADMSDRLLLARLAETVTWCDSRAGSDDHRTAELTPWIFHDGPDDLVCSLGRTRQLRLRYENLPVPSTAPVAARGRFMLYFPDENLSDGYAQIVSNGFFDVENVPAHDTWVSFFDEEARPFGSRRYLLSYVPDAALDAADAGGRW